VAQSPGEAPDARAICDSIDAITARRPRSPQEPRGESDPLVVEATGLMAQPSRQAVLAAIRVSCRSPFDAQTHPLALKSHFQLRVREADASLLSFVV